MMVSIKLVMSSMAHPKLYSIPIPAWGQPSLMAIKASFSLRGMDDLNICFPPMFISVLG